jgi:hypothetical protein
MGFGPFKGGSMSVQKDKEITISEKEYKYLKAGYNTLSYMQVTQGMCPKCQKSLLVSGYVCFECGFDPTYKEEEGA